MSDAMAEKAEQENKDQGDVQEKAQEELEARLWSITIHYDPVTGQGARIVSPNVTKQYQVDILRAWLNDYEENLKHMRALTAVLKQRDATKGKKGLFGAR